MPPNQLKYRVAISFAGPQREFAEAVALGLRNHGIRVFYDRFEQHVLWGRNLHDVLATVYNRSCRYCIMILTSDYVARMWTNFERQHLIDRLAKDHAGDFLLPVRLDGFDAAIEGLPAGIGFLSAESKHPQTVVEMFVKKIGAPSSIDAGRAYTTALQMLEEVGVTSGCLRPKQVFTSIEAVNRAIPASRRIGVDMIHGILGYRFLWRKKPNQLLWMFGGDVYEKQSKLKKICEIHAPEEWNGVGRWQLVAVQPRARRNRKTQSAIKDDEPNSVLLVIYIYSSDPELPFPTLKEKEETPTAAFLGAFLLDEFTSECFYDLAATRFKDIK